MYQPEGSFCENNQRGAAGASRGRLRWMWIGPRVHSNTDEAVAQRRVLAE